MGWNCISIYECWIQIGHMYTNALKYMYIKKKRYTVHREKYTVHRKLQLAPINK